MSFWKQEFPQRLKELREDIGVTQEEFARKISITRQSLSYYEKGERLPDIDILGRICDATGCSASYLLGFAENSIPSHEGLSESLTMSDEAIHALAKNPLGGMFLCDLVTHESFRALCQHYFLLQLCRTLQDSEPAKQREEMLAGMISVAFSKFLNTAKSNIVFSDGHPTQNVDWLDWLCAQVRYEEAEIAKQVEKDRAQDARFATQIDEYHAMIAPTLDAIDLYRDKQRDKKFAQQRKEGLI